MATEWISVDEQLPKKGQIVVVKFKFTVEDNGKSVYMLSRYDDGNNGFNEPHYLKGLKLAQWKPLDDEVNQ